MRDVRKRQKAVRHFYQRDELQACRVCGRYFTARRKEPICSMSCRARLDSGQEGRQSSTDAR